MSADDKVKIIRPNGRVIGSHSPFSENRHLIDEEEEQSDNTSNEDSIEGYFNKYYKSCLIINFIICILHIVPHAHIRLFPLVILKCFFDKYVSFFFERFPKVKHYFMFEVILFSEYVT